MAPSGPDVLLLPVAPLNKPSPACSTTVLVLVLINFNRLICTVA